MNRNQVLEEAKAAINRAPKSYGNPREHFERVARHWNSHLANLGVVYTPGQSGWVKPLALKPEDVAIMLGLVKIARLEHDPQHADSWCDLAGYAACGAEVSEPATDYKITIDTTPLPYWVSNYERSNTAPQNPFWWCVTHPEPPKQEPAWKRAKVGDRIRIREGARSSADMPLPSVAVVTEIDPRHEIHLHKNIVQIAGHDRNVCNDDVLEILPPLPESKFGFTVGETVNLKTEPVGFHPGWVVEFRGEFVRVQWAHKSSGDLHSVRPTSLRHGA